MKHVVTAAPIGQRLLVTGFGAFPGAPQNPTVAILKRLQRQKPRFQRHGITLDCRVIPVVYADLAATLHEAGAVFRPDAILHLGLATRRRHLSVETRAVNRAGPLHPDAAGRLPEAQVLAAGAPARLAATSPAAQILAAIRRRGLAADRSIDAGDYVCNAALYRSLLAAAAPRIGFLHVPRPRDPRRPVTRTRRAAPTLAALTEAVAAAILAMAGGWPPPAILRSGRVGARSRRADVALAPGSAAKPRPE